MEKGNIKFIQTGGPHSDYTHDFILDLELDCTVRQLVEEILKLEDYGCNRTGIRDQNYYEYNHDKFIGESIPEEIMDKVIYDCRASGCWHRMSYVIRTVEE